MLGRCLNIFVADDDPSVAEGLSLVLRAKGHRIESATDGIQAFARLTEQPGEFGLLIVDNTMPGLTGSELIQKLRAVNFNGKIMVLSGYLSPTLEDAYRALGVEYIVHKPYEISTIRTAVEEIEAATLAPGQE